MYFKLKWSKKTWIDENMGTNKKSDEDISKTDNFFVLYVINLFHDSLFTDISKYIRRKKRKTHRKPSEITFWHNTGNKGNFYKSTTIISTIKSVDLSRVESSRSE